MKDKRIVLFWLKKSRVFYYKEKNEPQIIHPKIRVNFSHFLFKKEFFKESSTHTTCPWKGLASYYTIEVDGVENNDAAWYYPSPSPLAESIKNHVAFWRGVKIEE